MIKPMVVAFFYQRLMLHWEMGAEFGNTCAVSGK